MSVSTPTNRRFINIIGAALDDLGIGTVHQVEYGRTRKEIRDAGDNDVSDSFQALGRHVISGSLIISDPLQADALFAADRGTFSFKSNPGDSGTTPTAGTALLVTIAGFKVTADKGTIVYEGVSGNVLQWSAFVADGSNPITIALDS